VDYAAFLRAAERGQLPPVVVLHGGDPQLLDDALAAATRGLFPEPTLAVFGREVLDAREVAADDLVRSAMTLPLMTAGRLVAIRHAQALGARASTIVAEYARDPNPSTCLLFLADESLEASRERKRHWLLDAVPPGSVVTLAVRQGRALADWLRQRATAEGLTVSEEAARLLVEWVGDDTAALLGETRKAALAGGGANRQIGVREVSAVVGEHRLAGVFDLTRAIDRRDVSLALRTLDRLLATEEPMRLLGLLASEVRMTWAIAELQARGQSAEQIARTLRRPSNLIAARLQSAGQGARQALAARLRRCWEVERRLKSGGHARSELAALVAEMSSEGA
jgi:DNA polymerase-3 subunit delta